jgi:hypothetical protein
VTQNALFSFPGRRLLRTYVGLVVSAGAIAIALAGFFGSGSGDLMLIVGLIVAGAASERFKVGLFGDSHVSLAAVACMVAALVGGPRDVAIVAPLLAIAANLGGPLPLYKTLFNIAVYVLSSLTYYAVFHLSGFAQFGSDWPQVVVPATVAGIAYFVTNAALVTGAVSLAGGSRFVAVFREKYLWLAPHYLPLGVLAAATASGYGFVGASVIPLFALPVASIQVAMFQYSSMRTRDLGQLLDARERIAAVEAELQQVMRIERRSAQGPHAA